MCGSIRYRMLGQPIFVHCCHCTECQKISGSAFAVNAIIEMENIHVQRGEPARQTVPTDTGRTQTIVRCPECGVALWSHHPDLGQAIALVFTGALEGAGLEPQAHCFTRSKQPWVELPEGIHTAETNYDPGACWPQASLNRLAAVLA